MKKIKIIVIAVITVSLSQLFLNCGQTDEDVVWQTGLKGYWIPVDTTGQIVMDIPTYLFLDNNRGASYYTSATVADSFNWEIKRAQLKIYYDEAPSYYIGYDKYNSRSLFKIKSMSDTVVSVVQFFSSGYQKEYRLLRHDYIEDQEDF
jgi:hypothetical protein